MTDFATYPSLRDRSVLITGGASGIGAGMVEHFADQGARVGFIDIDREAAERLLGSLGARARHCHFAAADLRDIAALRDAVGELRSRLGGPIVALVNNAARDDRHGIDAVTPEYWDERMATNLRHQFFAAQAVKDEMIGGGGGAIINMSSISFLLGQGGMPAYLTAKSAVIGLTRALARDLGKHMIRVNAVLPGWIMTDRQVSLWLTPEAEAEMLRGQCIPAKLYSPDVARMVLWLAADDSRMVTAQNFVVDGGWT
ncbi:MAG TPA: SDR family oxidoreductase [Stellaceae bacterium]|nr:SDR family oxidoreductase [Stellaceae bacterium]